MNNVPIGCLAVELADITMSLICENKPPKTPMFNFTSQLARLQQQFDNRQCIDLGDFNSTLVSSKNLP